MTVPVVPQRVLDSYHRHVGRPDPQTGCRVWLASVGSHGYGQIGWWEDGRSRMTVAHRVAWIDQRGPIPSGLTIDHICRNRRCVNVNHLRLLSNVDNAQDNGNARKTRCPSGHEYSSSNTRLDCHGFRYCRLCDQQRVR